jgi:chaperonin GroEL
VEEGIVAGGGVSLLRCVPAVEKVKLSGDQAVGAKIVRRALEEPLRQIAFNAGLEGAVVVDAVRKGKDSYGYDASAREYTDLVEAGIIDPTKVTRTALQNAASISGLMITTECLVTDIPEEEKMPPMPPGGGAPGMY